MDGRKEQLWNFKDLYYQSCWLILNFNLKNIDFKNYFVYKISNFSNTSIVSQFLISKKKNLWII